jgi:hypothetical protein
MRLLLLLAILAAATPALADRPVTLSLAAHGSAIELTFTNVSQQRVSFATRIQSDVANYDWLAVELVSGNQRRTLSFATDREESAKITADLAPGATATETIDLAWWAIRNNGAPLAPGTYDVRATWTPDQDQRMHVLWHLRASTKLTIAAPVEQRCTETKPGGKLELLARQAPGSSLIEVGVHNVDSVPHCIVAYVKTHEQQSDYLALSFDDAGTKREVRFDDDRNKSVPITVVLAPGATSWTAWDVAAWAARRRNGAHKIASGAQWVKLTYAPSARDAWIGTVSTDLRLTVR